MTPTAKETQRPTSTIPLVAALQYAALGWRVFPVHETDGMAWCACGKPECRSPAKHPRNANGFLGATTDPELINRWWRKWSKASVGIATGAASGLWVLDVDPADGGGARLQELLSARGQLPHTPTSNTGGGGHHYLFQHVAGWGSSTGKNHGFLGPGLDSRGDGGYIIAAPSLHISGGQYRWAVEPTTPLAPVPDWVRAMHAQHSKRQVQAAHRPAEPKPATQRADDFTAAVRSYNENNQRAFPAGVSPCPICPSPDGFKAHKIPGRWACFSSQHQHGGRHGNGHWFGDVLDLDAAQRNRTRKQHLEDTGYWDTGARVAAFAAARDARVTPSPMASIHQLHVTPGPPNAPAPTIPPRALTKSFASLCEIMETPDLAGPIFNGRALRTNTMSGTVFLSDVPVTDEDNSRVRRAIELSHCDRDGFGLTFSEVDVHKAMTLIASDNPFHPVRDYLNSLTWDGVERLDSLAGDMLQAPNTALNMVIARRWAISAVARAFTPGCKVDTMLVLCAPQGALKSTFFRTMAVNPDWFSDTPVNIHDVKHTAEQLRGVWIYEWSELESLRRARDEDAVKTFLSSACDNYRPAYGRHSVKVPRTCVIAGSTNRQEFLSDPTGNRRFWPIACGSIDIQALERQRDQLWAEAVAAHRAGEIHWLSEQERHDLAAVQVDHHIVDEWEALILPWVEARTTPPTTAEVLSGPLDLEPGRWGRPEQMRVGAILRREGYAHTRATNGGRARRWVMAPP